MELPELPPHARNRKSPPHKKSNNEESIPHSYGKTSIKDNQFTRKNLKNVIHLMTQEIKTRGTKTPHIFLPFRSRIDDSKLEKFLMELFPKNGELAPSEQYAELFSRTDEFTLICGLKYLWCRLPNHEVIGWEVYQEFYRREKAAGYPRNAFLQLMPKCLSSQAHASIVYDFLDLLISVTSNSQYNFLSGRKVAKMAALWGFNCRQRSKKPSTDGSSSNIGKTAHPFYDATIPNDFNFVDGLEAWKSTSGALFHLVLSFLRAMLPDNEQETLKLPKTLQQLLITNSYPPSDATESLKSQITIPCILVRSTKRSKSAYELLSKVRNTISFDKKDAFVSMENYTILKNIFMKESTTDIVSTLTEESRRILGRILADPIKSEFDIYPGWSRVKVESNQSSSSILNLGSTDTENLPLISQLVIMDVTLQDYYIWTWLSSLGSDQCDDNRTLFGRSLVVEAGIKGFEKWLIVTEELIQPKEYYEKYQSLVHPPTLDHKNPPASGSSASSPRFIKKDLPLPPIPQPKRESIDRPVSGVESILPRINFDGDNTDLYENVLNTVNANYTHKEENKPINPKPNPESPIFVSKREDKGLAKHKKPSAMSRIPPTLSLVPGSSSKDQIAIQGLKTPQEEYIPTKNSPLLNSIEKNNYDSSPEVDPRITTYYSPDKIPLVYSAESSPSPTRSKQKKPETSFDKTNISNTLKFQSQDQNDYLISSFDLKKIEERGPIGMATPKSPLSEVFSAKEQKESNFFSSADTASSGRLEAAPSIPSKHETFPNEASQNSSKHELPSPENSQLSSKMNKINSNNLVTQNSSKHKRASHEYRQLSPERKAHLPEKDNFSNDASLQKTSQHEVPIKEHRQRSPGSPIRKNVSLDNPKSELPSRDLYEIEKQRQKEERRRRRKEKQDEAEKKLMLENDPTQSGEYNDTANYIMPNERFKESKMLESMENKRQQNERNQNEAEISDARVRQAELSKHLHDVVQSKKTLPPPPTDANFNMKGHENLNHQQPSHILQVQKTSPTFHSTPQFSTEVKPKDLSLEKSLHTDQQHYELSQGNTQGNETTRYKYSATNDSYNMIPQSQYVPLSQKPSPSPENNIQTFHEHKNEHKHVHQIPQSARSHPPEQAPYVSYESEPHIQDVYVPQQAHQSHQLPIHQQQLEQRHPVPFANNTHTQAPEPEKVHQNPRATNHQHPGQSRTINPKSRLNSNPPELRIQPNKSSNTNTKKNQMVHQHPQPVAPSEPAGNHPAGSGKIPQVVGARSPAYSSQHDIPSQVHAPYSGHTYSQNMPTKPGYPGYYSPVPEGNAYLPPPPPNQARPTSPHLQTSYSPDIGSSMPFHSVATTSPQPVLAEQFSYPTAPLNAEGHYPNQAYGYPPQQYGYAPYGYPYQAPQMGYPPMQMPYVQPPRVEKKKTMSEMAMLGMPMANKHDKNKQNNKAGMRAALSQGNFGI